MSKKRMVYAEDVIQRIRDLAPEILGGWLNPDYGGTIYHVVEWQYPPKPSKERSV